VALSCPVCARRVETPFAEIRGVPVHVSALHRSANGARTAYRGDLELAFCESCGFIWNAAYDASLVAYDADYENSLDHSPAFAGYVEGLAGRLVERYGLHGARVAEIGCGQADFLHRLCAAGAAAGYGFDPSYVGPERDGPVTVKRELYAPGTVNGTEPDLVCCRHVLEHVEHPLELLRSLRRTLDPARGVPVYFEVPNGEHQLREGVVWDMIYAHFATFTRPSLRTLFELAGFEVLDTGTAFGGQYLWIEARPTAHPVRSPRAEEVDAVRDLVREFASGYDALVGAWRRRVDGYAASGRRVALWGAGAKGVTLVNALEHTGDIGVVVDVNPRKHGSFVPGAGVPVVAPSALGEYTPDVVVVANPIYRDEVAAALSAMGQQALVVCV
jgi:SAM-dependent methyltransferase